MKISPLLKKIYGEIILGFSRGNVFGRGCIIRHFTPKDQAEIDSEFIFYLERAKREGLLEESDKIKELIKTGDWSEDNDIKLSNLSLELGNLKNTKTQLIFKEQIQPIEDRIVKVSEELNKLSQEKASLIGITADSFANKKINELYIYCSFYDEDNSKRLFGKEEFRDFDYSEIDTIARHYNEVTENFRDSNLKRAALNPSFQNYLSLCGDNISSFFGKPIIDLSFYQCELISYGRYFKHILSGEIKPSQKLLDDPDALMDWHNKSTNLKKTIGDSNVGTVGATPEEIKEITGQEQVDFTKELEKTAQKSVRGKDVAKLLGF